MHGGVQDVSRISFQYCPRAGRGGSTGNAWLIGVIAGLHEAGVDVTEADVVIGTSAGATVAAQLVGSDPLRLLADIRAASEDAGVPAVSATSAPVSTAATNAVAAHLERSMRLIHESRDVAEMRQRIGAAALARAAEHDPSEQWHDTVAARFPAREWPRRRLLITAVDASTGEPVVFDRDSGVALVDAVAAWWAHAHPDSLGARLGDSDATASRPGKRAS